MNDLGSSWYINSESDDVEVYEITADMITDKIFEKYYRFNLRIKEFAKK